METQNSTENTSFESRLVFGYKGVTTTCLTQHSLVCTTKKQYQHYTSAYKKQMQYSETNVP